MNKLELSIVIPCLNEKDTITQVIDDARKNAEKCFQNSFEILISDNGSTDGTLEIVKAIKNVKVINVPIKGYGAALHWGILSASGKYVLFADADMSYPFSNLKKFKKTVNRQADLVLGSRFRGDIETGSMPFLHRYLGTPVLSFLIRLIYNISTSDCNSGMRMIKKSFYEKLNMRNSGMEWASELLLRTALNKGIYLEVPISFKKDRRNRKPHLSTWSDGWRHLKSILLLKPDVLYIFLLIFSFLSIYFYVSSFVLAFLFAILFFVLFLSICVLEMLYFTVSKQKTLITKFLLNANLVPISMFVVIAMISIIWFLPESRLGTKLFFAGIIGIIFMWVFLIETIKTYLINKLPE